jgi:hypothetical protein
VSDGVGEEKSITRLHEDLYGTIDLVNRHALAIQQGLL